MSRLMSRKIFNSTLLVILMMTLAPSLVMAAPHPQSTEFAATLEVYTEGVEVKRAETEQWIAVTGRAVVAAGDSVRTNETGEAMIIWFDDGTLVELRPSTEIVINAFNGDPESDQFVIETQVLLGQVFNNVAHLINQDSRYTVVTPTMQAAVRGTTFGIDVQEDAQSTIAVGKGIVAVSQGENEQQVEAGFWLRASVPEQPESSAVAPVAPAPGSESTDNGTGGDGQVEQLVVVELSDPVPFSEAGDDAILNELIAGVTPTCAGTIDSPSSSPIRIYNFPADSAELIGTAAIDQAIEVLAQLGDGSWAEIAWNGAIGWVPSQNARIEDACRTSLPIVTGETPLPIPLRLQ
ncbi:MAG: FecR domain-containing protein [Chloroflexi bacterium]|nr:FecR domain-containing protein [Chloroflexota bacterium]